MAGKCDPDAVSVRMFLLNFELLKTCSEGSGKQEIYCPARKNMHLGPVIWLQLGRWSEGFSLTCPVLTFISKGILSDHICWLVC